MTFAIIEPSFHPAISSIRYLDHEKLAARESRQRRYRLGLPNAAYVLLAWQQRQRIARFKRMSPEQRKELFGWPK